MNYDFSLAQQHILSYLKAKNLYLRGNWEKSVKDGFWTYLDDQTNVSINMARNNWQKIGLAELFDNGVTLAREFLANN